MSFKFYNSKNNISCAGYGRVNDFLASSSDKPGVEEE